MLFSNVAVDGDVFEIVSTQFKEGTSLDDQRNTMSKLNDIVCGFDGFKSRDYFYSTEIARWLDFVVWTDLDAAKKASEQLMTMPDAGAIFEKIDESSMIFSHYERVGGVNR